MTPYYDDGTESPVSPQPGDVMRFIGGRGDPLHVVGVWRDWVWRAWRQNRVR